MIDLNDSQRMWAESEVRRIAGIEPYTGLDTSEFADYLFDTVQKSKPKTDDVPYIVKRLGDAVTMISQLNEIIKSQKDAITQMNAQVDNLIAQNDELEKTSAIEIEKAKTFSQKEIEQLASINSDLEAKLDSMNQSIIQLQNLDELNNVDTSTNVVDKEVKAAELTETVQLDSLTKSELVSLIQTIEPSYDVDPASVKKVELLDKYTELKTEN